MKKVFSGVSAPSFFARGAPDRVSVWSADGEREWDRSCMARPPGRATIAVRPEHAGKLWWATGGAFVIDARILPYFSISRAKWFNPDE